MSQAKKETIWTRNFSLLFTTNIVAYIGQSMLNTLLQIYAEDLGASSSLIGTIVGIFSVTALLLRPFTGSAIDSLNKKHLLVGAMSVITVAIFGYGLSLSIPVLIFFRLMHGIGMGFTGPLCLTMATDSLPPSKIASGIGVYTLGVVIAQAFGPAIGLEIAETFSCNAAFFFAGALNVAAVAIAMLIKYEHVSTRKFTVSLSGMVAKEALVPASMTFLTTLSTAGVNSFLVLYAESKGISGVSLFFTVNSFALLVSRPVAGMLSDKYGVDKTIIPCLVFYVLSMITMAVADSNIMLYIAAVLYAFGYGTAYPSIQALGMKVVPAERRGAGTNTLYIGTDTAYLVGPVIAGIIVDVSNYETMFYASVIPPIAVAAILLIWLKKIGGIPAAANN